MDSGKIEEVRSEVDALVAGLSEERFRHVAGLAPAPRLPAVFSAHGLAAHRDTVVMLREAGERELAARVAGLVAERMAAAEEEAWRAADAAATGDGPDGQVGLSDAALSSLHERDRDRRRALGRAVAGAALASSAPREAAAETRASARAGLGLTPAWEDVVQADEVLAASEGAYQEVLAWFARQQGLELPPRGGPRPAPGSCTCSPSGTTTASSAPRRSPRWCSTASTGSASTCGSVRLDGAARAAKWPGAHAFEGRVSLRRQGGLADWLDLPDAAGRAAAAATSRPSTRDPALPATVGALGAWLLLEPRFLESATGPGPQARARRRSAGWRSASSSSFAPAPAALRVAVEVERGTGGRAWHEAHREALSRADAGRLAGRARGPGRRRGALRESLAGAAWAAAIRHDLRERFDEDYWRNPRTGEALAGRLAAGSPGPENGEAPARSRGGGPGVRPGVRPSGSGPGGGAPGRSCPWSRWRRAWRVRRGGPGAPGGRAA